MKFALVCLFALVAVAYVTADGESYTSKFDNINVDEILQSDRLLNNYFKCLMDTGRCTAEGTELKKVLPDALKTECAKCSEKQKEMSQKVIKFLVENKPEMWKALTEKFDPDGVLKKKYEQTAQKAGIKI